MSGGFGVPPLLPLDAHFPSPTGFPVPQPTIPFAQGPPLAAPRAQPPPSAIPTDRLATQADDWANGHRSSPALPNPKLPQQHGYNNHTASTSSYASSSMPPQHLGGGWNGVQQQPMDNGMMAGGAGPGYGGGPSQFSSGPTTSQHSRPASSYTAAPPPPPPQQPYYQNAPPPPPPATNLSHSQSFNSYQQQQPGPLQPPPPTNYGYHQQQAMPPPPLAGPPQPPQQPYYANGQQQQYNNQLPPRAASTMAYGGGGAPIPPSLDSLSLGGGGGPASHSAPATPLPITSRPNYYAKPEDGPPYKLSVTHPDQKMLASMRETANAGSGDVNKKVAWAKQVLKFIERHQSSAGESSRINDPTLVRWTDEALTSILSSASSSSPVPLALYLRGDLSSSGSFPSYRSKDTKLAFRDFEAAANSGYVKAWFRIGRAYEDHGDVRRAVGAYEKGVEKGDCGSTYRLAMAYLLGQIGVTMDSGKAMALLKRAADTADLDTPQPPYILGMILSGEFDSPAVKLQKDIVPLNLDEAKWRIERAAFLSFGPAQYKMGFAYEYATLGCLFDPLLSVQYYALASQNGEVEADMALSKWYLCGSEGNFDKNEALACTFAEKAASRQLPSAEFALGYFREVGIAGQIDLDQAKRWYSRAASHGNDDAKKRLEALTISESNMLSRTDHDAQIDSKLVRKRTAAKIRSDEQRERIEETKRKAEEALERRSQQHQQQQQQQQYGAGGGGDPRYQLPANGHSNTHRRRDTLRQVEAAAHRPGGGGQQRYQLSDSPARAPSSNVSSASSGSGGGRARPPAGGAGGVGGQGEIQMQAKPATFAEMGIATTKAKRDSCVIS